MISQVTGPTASFPPGNLSILFGSCLEKDSDLKVWDFSNGFWKPGLWNSLVGLMNEHRPAARTPRYFWLRLSNKAERKCRGEKNHFPPTLLSSWLKPPVRKGNLMGEKQTEV